MKRKKDLKISIIVTNMGNNSKHIELALTVDQTNEL